MNAGDGQPPSADPYPNLREGVRRLRLVDDGGAVVAGPSSKGDTSPEQRGGRGDGWPDGVGGDLGERLAALGAWLEGTSAGPSAYASAYEALFGTAEPGRPRQRRVVPDLVYPRPRRARCGHTELARRRATRVLRNLFAEEFEILMTMEMDWLCSQSTDCAGSSPKERE